MPDQGTQYKHYDAATRAAVRGTKAFLVAFNLPHRNTDIFNFHGIRCYRSGMRILAGTSKREMMQQVREPPPFSLFPSQVRSEG